MASTYAMGLRNGNWDYPAMELAWHCDVEVQLAPDDAPGVLVRFVSGISLVTRELGAADVVEIQVCGPTGQPVLSVRPADGSVELRAGTRPGGEWELRIAATGQRQVHLYARPETPFPSEEDLDALAAAATVVTPR